MLFLLDTNAVNEVIKENPRMGDRLARASRSDTVAICTIVRGEVLFGIERMPEGRKRRDLATKASGLLADLPCYSVPSPAADHYARIKHACRRKGLPLDENDLWIAATALALGATLVTRDADFARVERLTVEDWTV